MYKFLEYGDAHYVVDYIYESDIYDEEKFLFAPDVDILKTSELDIRNSLFTYFMQIFVEMDKTRNIKNILLCQTNQKQRDNNTARIELLSISDTNFVDFALEKLCSLLIIQEIKKIKITILKEQLNDKVISILLSSGFEMECIYKSKDNNDNLDIITLSKIL